MDKVGCRGREGRWVSRSSGAARGGLGTGGWAASNKVARLLAGAQTRCCSSLPLNSPRRLAGHIVHDAVHAANCRQRGRQQRRAWHEQAKWEHAPARGAAYGGGYARSTVQAPTPRACLCCRSWWRRIAGSRAGRGTCRTGGESGRVATRHAGRHEVGARALAGGRPPRRAASP